MFDKKFRVWNPVTEKMTYFRLGEPYQEKCEGRTCIVMGYIGACDKQGYDIYECDVVSHRLLDRPHDKRLYGDVALAHQSANPKMIVAYKDFGFYPFRLFMEDTFHDLEWEILGNVFELGIFKA